MRVLGTPKPSIQWYKDDLELFACERVELREEEEGGAVVLRAARFSDSGVVKCVATNILGRAVSIAQLAIEGNQYFVCRIRASMYCKHVFYNSRPTFGASGKLCRRAYI